MHIIKSICIAISTYSVLPVPRFVWTGENLRVSLAALPLVGLPIGGFLLLWHRLCLSFGIGPLLFAAVAAVLPVLITGGIHMDGFCDTTDAITSRREQARKLEILQDPHVGAFAVIYVCVYLLLCFGLYAELFPAVTLIQITGIGFVFSRALTVCSAVTMPNAKKGGMLAALKEPLPRRGTLAVNSCCFLLCAAGMLLLHTAAGLFCILLCALWWLAYRRMVTRHFGGVTGDTTGFFLQVTELLILLGAVLGKLTEGMV